MTVSELEETYRQLHEQLLRGELEEEEFKTEVDQLRFQDDLGNRWKIGWYTGKWYRYDQGQWVQGEPRDRLAQAAPLPAPDVAPGKEGKQQGRSRAAYLVIALIALLLLASVALIFGWNQDREGKPEEDTPAVALITSTESGATTSTELATAAPTTPSASPTSHASPTRTSRATTTPSRAPARTETRLPPTPTPTRSPATKEPTATSPPPPTATPEPTASVVPTPRPLPTATATFSGRIFFPVYDPRPDRRTFDIHSIQLDSGKREVVVGQASQPALSPSRQRLAYRSWNTSQRGIMVRELTDGSTWLWVRFHEAERPNWSPDNANIVFSSQQESDRRWRLYRTWGPDSERVRREGGDIFARAPTWSADGRLIFWECPLAACGLYAMHTDGTSLERLTMQEHDTTPAMSPDGRQVAFMSNVNGNWEIFVTGSRSPGGQGNPEPTRLTRNGARDGLPTWSPDGQSLAFISDREGTWAVWVMRPDGSEQQKLFDLDGSPEGEVNRIPPSEQHGWTWESIAWGR